MASYAPAAGDSKRKATNQTEEYYDTDYSAEYDSCTLAGSGVHRGVD
jgi:hypothetical protein